MAIYLLVGVGIGVISGVIIAAAIYYWSKKEILKTRRERDAAVRIADLLAQALCNVDSGIRCTNLVEACLPAGTLLVCPDGKTREYGDDGIIGVAKLATNRGICTKAEVKIPGYYPRR